VPAYRVPGVDGPEGLVCALPDTLLLRPADGTGDAQLDELAGRLGLDLDAGRTAYTAPFRVYRVRDPKARNAYELREELEGEAVVADVRLETMTMLVPTSLHPDDPLYARQWGVQRIGAPAAWDLTTGDPGTVIGVIDEGCDLGHPDLRFSGRGVNLGSMRPGGGPTGDHGTPCGERRRRHRAERHGRQRRRRGRPCRRSPSSTGPTSSAPRASATPSPTARGWSR